MPEKSKILSLFDLSGNLTINAMEHYLRDELSTEQQTLVEKHLAENEFDREALEGLKKHASANIGQDVADLQRDILLMTTKKAWHGHSRGSRRSYWYAAAGLAALVSLPVILFFLFRGEINEPQLAVIQPDTIINETVQVARNENKTPVKEIDNIPEKKSDNEIAAVTKPLSEKVSISSEAAPEPAPAGSGREPEEISQPVMVVQNEVELDEVASYEDQIVGGVIMMEEIESGKENLQENEKGVAASGRTMAKNSIYRSDNGIPESKEDTTVFLSVENMPEFPGGEEALNRYLNDSIHYPELAIEKKIQGRVFISFVVKEDGSVIDARVLRGIGGGCDEEALRVIKAMPSWIPGKQYGIPVRVQVNLPVKFIIDGLK
jgi:protein TonB